MTPKITQHVASRNGKKNRVFTKSSRGAIDHTTAALMLGLAAVSIVGMLGFFYLQQVVHTASQSTHMPALK